MKPNLEKKYELAKVLGYRLNRLTYIVYIIPEESQYIRFTIPKKNGGLREINSPCAELKNLQTRLAIQLAESYETHFEGNSTKQIVAHGFRKGYSIKTNAEKHKNRRYVFNVDLKDFFGTINFGRVRGFFLKSRDFCYSAEVATVIAKIVCHKNGLPQGSPTSPVISNLIGVMLDNELVHLAAREKCTYSRYADDITFSTNKKEFPESIAFFDEKDSQWHVGSSLQKAIEKQGYVINYSKVSMQYKTSRQEVTGLIVNRIVNIPRDYYRITRAYCNSLFRHGEYYKRDGNNDNNKVIGTKNELEGRLSYIYSIRKKYYYGKNNKYNAEGIVKLYKRFIIYKYFIDSDFPVVVTEGKTDSIYIKCALVKMIGEYPSLVTKKENGYSYAVHFFNYSSLIKEIFGISSGTSGQYELLKVIEGTQEIYKNNKKRKPAIFLCDSDSGSKDIRNKICKLKNSKDLDLEKDYPVFANVHVVFSTIEDKQEIEDLFDISVLNTIVDGRRFCRHAETKNNEEYSKSVFAHRVIKPNIKTIDFSRFKRILDLLKSICQET